MWRTFPRRRTVDERIFLAVLVATEDQTVAKDGKVNKGIFDIQVIDVCFTSVYSST